MTSHLRLGWFTLVSIVASASLGGCPRREGPVPPAPPGTVVASADAASPRVAVPPTLAIPADALATADALVVVPGQGIGPVSLGADRSAVEHIGLGAGISTAEGRFVRYGALEVVYSEPTPGGTVSSVRVRVAECPGGVRVNGTPLAPGASYAAVKLAAEPCAPVQNNEGGNVTLCQDGALEILQAGPTQILMVGVHGS